MLHCKAQLEGIREVTLAMFLQIQTDIYYKIYFVFLVARGIQLTSTCFQVLSSSPFQVGTGDRGGVCLLAGGPLDCSQSSFFP